MVLRGRSRAFRGRRLPVRQIGGSTAAILSGRSSQREVGGGHRQVAVQQAGIGSLQPGPEPVHLGEGEPVEAEGGELVGHRVGPDGQRAPVHDRLDGRVAEPLPGGGQDDHVAGLVGVVDGERRPSPSGCAQDDRARRPGHQGVELGAVAVLGRAEQPVRRLQTRWPPAGRRPRSCGGWPGWVGAPADGRRRCPTARRSRRRRPPSLAVRSGGAVGPPAAVRARRRCCRRWWRRCPGRPAGGGSAR